VSGQLILTVVLALASAAGATEIHVAPTGDDSAKGDSTAAALKTIGKACVVAQPGDSIIVADGVYVEGEVKLFKKNATAEKPTVIKAANKHQAIIRSTSPYHALTIAESENVIVDGLAVSMKEPEKHHLFGVLVVDSNHVTVRNCYVYDVGSTGIQANGGEHYIIEDNIVRNVSWATGSPNGSGISFYHPRYVPDYKEGEWGIICRRNIIFDNYCPFKEFTEFPTDGNGIILDDFKNSQKHDINDDHLPLIAAGVKTIDIIDFDYAPWHTLDDTADKCSEESLEKVGRTIAKVVYDEKPSAK
jgi:hypothetical protein